MASAAAVAISGGLAMTAANPAACPDCFTYLHGEYEPNLTKHVHWCHERIRALEAELADLKEREIPAWLRLEKTWYDKNHKLEAHVKELETVIKELTAMLYELRSQRDYAMAIQEDRER